MHRTNVTDLFAAALAGAIAQYLFDPVSGRRRRTQLAQQAAGRVRRPARRAQDRLDKKSTLVRDRAAGMVHELRTRRSPGVPEDDISLVDKIRSEVLGNDEWRRYSLNIDAFNGTVTLRGQVDRADMIDQLEREVSQVPGTFRVVNLLHLPGEPAPNVEDALRASAGHRSE